MSVSGKPCRGNGGGGGGAPTFPVDSCVIGTPDPPPDPIDPGNPPVIPTPIGPAPPSGGGNGGGNGPAAPTNPPSSTACQAKIQNALDRALSTYVVPLGPTYIPPGQMDPRLYYGGRNGAYNFNYFAPGVANPVAGSANGSGRFPGSGLHVPLPGGADPVISIFGPGMFMDQNGSFLTAHFDSGNPLDDLISFFQHIINDVLGRKPHGC